MSIASMALKKKDDDEPKVLKYNDDVWKGFISIDSVKVEDHEILQHLKSVYKNVYLLQMVQVKTFGGNFVNIKELYQDDMDHNGVPYCVLIKDKKGFKLITTKAKRAKEFSAFKSSVKNVYVPLLLYKNKDGHIKSINYK